MGKDFFFLLFFLYVFYTHFCMVYFCYMGPHTVDHRGSAGLLGRVDVGHFLFLGSFFFCFQQNTQKHPTQHLWDVFFSPSSLFFPLFGSPAEISLFPPHPCLSWSSSLRNSHTLKAPPINLHEMMRSACVTILLLGLLLAQKANATNVTLCFSLSVSDASYEPEFYGCAQTDNYCRGGPNSFDFTSPTERATVTWKYPTSCEGHGMVCSTAWEFYPSDNTLAIYLAGDDRYTCSLTGVSSNYYKYDCEGRSASVSFFNS